MCRNVRRHRDSPAKVADKWGRPKSGVPPELAKRVEFVVGVENQMLRGTVHPVITTRMVTAARDQLKADLCLPVLAPEELYGGETGGGTGPKSSARLV